GDPNTSAQIKIGAQGTNKSYLFTREIIIENGASLIAWSPKSIGQATTSGGGSVVFLSEIPDYYDLYVIDLQTNSVRQLTSISGAGEYNPSWSPDDLKIAHDVVRGDYPFTGPGEEHSIYITDVATGVGTPLVGAKGGNDAAWSPDGLTIAFDRLRMDDPNIYTVPATGGTRTLLVTNATDPDWSPIGNRLVFHRPTTGEILTVNKAGHGETTVTTGYQPVWSPDTSWIAYVYNNDVWKIKVNTSGKPKGEPINLTNDPDSGDWQPSWTRDNEAIVFHSNRNGDADIYTISVTGGTPTKLAGLIDYGDYDPSVSNGGQQVVYSGFTEPVTKKQAGSLAKNSGNANEKLNMKKQNTNDGRQNIFAKPEIPQDFNLRQNYPNPFNPTTTIEIFLPQATFVSLNIYNILGEAVATLVSENLNPGTYKYRWDASGLASGIYFSQIQAGDFLQRRKMILMK
nr:T9SS type A sorting domain-containing protein [Fodinibius sp.]NIV11260.1 T9SS type A sorting domain-containing protein [Fodinibius sp.]NIY24879.1 T9SS type A sorting domain-containing protein [Fodinibius sp.]